MRNHAIKEVECNKSIPFQLVPPEVSIKRRRPRSHSIKAKELYINIPDP